MPVQTNRHLKCRVVVGAVVGGGVGIAAGRARTDVMLAAIVARATVRTDARMVKQMRLIGC